ncbi:MAG: cytochrome P450 [Sporichthyaceae bacterium]
MDLDDFLPATAEHKPGYDEVDLSTTAFWQQNLIEQDESFGVLRAARPVSWQRPADFAQLPDPDDPGYWAVTGHAEIKEVSRHHEVFISGQGIMYDTLPREILELSLSFEAMDGPRHARIRSLVARAFTPAQVRRMQETIDRTARELLLKVLECGDVDFAVDVATPLPLMTFAQIMGVPEDQRGEVADAVADLMAWADPEVLAGRDAAQVQFDAVLALHAIAGALYAERSVRPTEDLVTALVQAEVDGARLLPEEFGAFFVLMAVAATDTTKHTASFAALALTDFAEQRAWLLADLDRRLNSAVEEMIRYGTVVMNMRRTAAVQTELGGMHLRPGDKVVMFYSSGNRDEAVFRDPHALDLARDPNPHLGFGGGGVHHCFGAHLARAHLRALFAEMLVRCPDFHAGEPRYLGSNFMRGITHLRVNW